MGVSPTYPESLESQFVQVKKKANGINEYPEDNIIFDKGGLSLGSYLYSAIGSQSAGISQFFMEDYSLDPKDLESQFLFDI